MGIHTWDGYVEYENAALKSYLETIERFCTNCHTNEDYGSCEKCPTGIFVRNLRRYLLNACESDELKDKTKLLRQMKQLIKKMPKLHPLYLTIDDEAKPDSVFNRLKKVSFELDLWKKCFDERANFWLSRKELFDKVKDKKKEVKE